MASFMKVVNDRWWRGRDGYAVSSTKKAFAPEGSLSEYMAQLSLTDYRFI